MKLLFKLLTVLSLLCVTALAQERNTAPPHALFAPQSYHIDVPEIFSLTSYTRQPFDVTAAVLYDNCRCTNSRRRCDNSFKNVHSEATRQARFGRPVELRVQMPNIDQLANRNYAIRVTSHNGSVSYLSRTQIFFPTDAFGFLLIRTDKPIYKPGQTVKYCMTFLDKTLKPHSSSSNVEITIRDSKFKQIIKLDSVRLAARDITCLDFPLSEEPNFGTWNINARVVLPDEQGGCRPPYSLPRGGCAFKVEEFVLPRFEVTLTGPKQLERDDDTISGLVKAEYTFGEPLQGTVKINATLTASGRQETLVFYDITATLTNGEYSFSIPSERYRQMVRYRYDPFCVRSSVTIIAEATEAGRGAKASASHRFSLVSSPVDVQFAEDNPKVFRPGLTYKMKALAKLADGSPALGSSVRVMVSINNGDSLLMDEELATNTVDGILTSDIPVPLNANCMKISLRPSSQLTSCTEEFECFSPSPMFSPTKSFLQLTDVSTLILRPTARADIRADATVPFNRLHLLVISQGGLQHHEVGLERGGNTSTVVSFRITHSMTPRVKVLGFFVREDGEIVADLIELEIQCDLQNRMTLAFNQSFAEPGDPVTITATASPASFVLMSVADKSLSLLADTCKSLEKDNVCRLLRELTRGALFGGQSCNSDNNRACCPLTCSEPTIFGVNNILSAAGVTLYSNMFRPNPPTVRRPPVEPKFPFFPELDIGGPPGPNFRGPQPGLGIPPEEIVPVPEPEGEDEARTFFPESWIFQVQQTDRSGQVVLDTTTPDTITTWFAESFALHRRTGLGISRQAQLTVKKLFFVSLELPFSINFRESVVITPLVFNLDRTQLFVGATITVQVDDDLDIVENSLTLMNNVLTIPRSSSTPFSLKLRPRAIGQLAITIAAVSTTGETDTVRKLLFVKPGCERFELTENVLAEGTGEHCFNYSLPSCVIPGSASATISATGDIMSPPDLDRLLVLPSGCGEQNLVRTATNWVVAEYLVATEQLQDFIAVKVKNNVQRGYQRQLTYLQGSGCFSVWSRGSCSLWLTAAVVNVFSGIVNFYKVQEPGTELIDMSVINGALNYVINNQQESGAIPIIGRVHNYRLLNEEHLAGHTAFGVAALKEYVDTFAEDESETTNVQKARKAILSAELYLETTYNDDENEFCNYGLSLMAYSLFRSPARELRLKERLLTDLRSRIVTSKTYPGACFVCDRCPSDGDEEGDQGPECVSRPRGEGSAACVETTAYTLLALLEAEDTQFTVCLAQWLVRIRSRSGGFYSSQDTVIAMRALAAFGEESFTSELNKQLTFNVPGLGAEVLSITNTNRFERTDKEVPAVPSNNNCVSWSGEGTAIIQSTLTYHGCDCCADTQTFSLELASERKDSPIGTLLDLFVRIRYLRGGVSNMAIVDVEIPSGYVFIEWKFQGQGKHAELERVDRRGANIVFYFNNVPSDFATTFIVEFQKRFTVDNPQQSPVTIYDYYDPGQIITKFYLPATSEPLPKPTTGPPEVETEILPPPGNLPE